MKQLLILFCLTTFLFSCNNQQQQEEKPITKEYLGFTELLTITKDGANANFDAVYKVIYNEQTLEQNGLNDANNLNSIFVESTIRAQIRICVGRLDLKQIEYIKNKELQAQINTAFRKGINFNGKITHCDVQIDLFKLTPKENEQ